MVRNSRSIVGMAMFSTELSSPVTSTTVMQIPSVSHRRGSCSMAGVAAATPVMRERSASVGFSA